MPFSEEVKDRAFLRARGRCECHSRGHGHRYNCGSPLTRQTAHFIRLNHLKDEFNAFNCHVVCYECLVQIESGREP